MRAARGMLGNVILSRVSGYAGRYNLRAPRKCPIHAEFEMSKSTQTRQTISSASAARSVPPNLAGALWQYQIDSDLLALRRAYSAAHTAHASSKIKPTGIARLVHAAAHVVDAFIIEPRPDPSRMVVFENRTDAEAIESDWAMVGEDLSRAMILHILGEEKAREKTK